MKQHSAVLRTILLIAVPLCLLAVAVVLVLQLMDSFPGNDSGSQNSGSQSMEQPGTTDASEPVSTDPQATAHTVGQLVLYYGGNDLIQSQSETGVYTLLPTGATQDVPRLDLQVLSGSLRDLQENEVQQLAVALLQAYYVDAPAADTISVTQDTELGNAYILEVPAVEDTPALAARVRFLEAMDGLWYVILLDTAAETSSTALVNAYETARTS